MKTALLRFIAAFLAETPLLGQSSIADTPIFADKNLEAAVRKYVFEKRDTTKPITASDVRQPFDHSCSAHANQGLEGLGKMPESCLAAVDKDLSGLNYLFLEHNKITDAIPLAKALEKDFEGKSVLCLT